MQTRSETSAMPVGRGHVMWWSALARAAGVMAAASVVLIVPAPVVVEAKAPGVKHCYRSVCHRVRTLDQTRRLIGRTLIIETSYYDHPSVDRFNVGTYTSNGERFDANDPARVASADLPDGTELLLRNPDNGRVSHVRVNDFGPFRGDRRLDVTRRVADDLGFRRQGVTKLEVTVIAAPQPEDLAYRRNRPRQATSGHLGNFRDDELPTLIVALTGENRGLHVPEAVAVVHGVGVHREPAEEDAVWSAMAPTTDRTTSISDGSTEAEVERVTGPWLAIIDAVPASVAEAISIGADSVIAVAHATASAGVGGPAAEHVMVRLVDDASVAQHSLQLATATAVSAMPVHDDGAVQLAWGNVRGSQPSVDGDSGWRASETGGIQLSLAMFETERWWSSATNGHVTLLTVVAALSSLLLAVAFRAAPERDNTRLAPAGSAAATRRSARTSDAAAGLQTRSADRDAASVEIVTSSAPGFATTAAPARASVIAEGLSLTGRIRSRGELAIGGEVIGGIEAERLEIVAGGRVEGEVRGEIVDIAGDFKGRLVAHTLVIRRGATVSGEIVVAVLEVAEGAAVEAAFRRLNGCWRGAA